MGDSLPVQHWFTAFAPRTGRKATKLAIVNETRRQPNCDEIEVQEEARRVVKGKREDSLSSGLHYTNKTLEKVFRCITFTGCC